MSDMIIEPTTVLDLQGELIMPPWVDFESEQVLDHAALSPDDPTLISFATGQHTYKINGRPVTRATYEQVRRAVQRWREA